MATTAQRKPADRAVGALRAIGQGLGMGWSDEAEAKARAMSGTGDYETQLKRIRGEYGQYASENPKTAFALEMLGGAAPMAASVLIPGMQAAAVAQGGGALAKLAALGAATGAVGGAGSAESDRTAGALAGGGIGGALGVAAPLALRGIGAGGRWLAERLNPTEARISGRAAEKLNAALAQTKMTPQEIEKALVADRALGVPSVVANVSGATADLAKAVAQRTGEGTRKVEDTLAKQSLGSRERTHQQIVKGLNPGDYYSDVEALSQSLKTRAKPLYENAYAVGEVSDPEVLKFLQLPQFKQAIGEAKKLLQAEGRDLPTIKIQGPASIDPATGKPIPGEVGEKLTPTVEVLDQVKRGLDALIERETDSVTGKTTSLGRVYVNKKNEFLNALDSAVPEYAQARAVYRGDAELMDSLRKGMNDFSKMDHEQVTKLVSGMSDAEKAAFRTGVSRGLYSEIMKPSGNFNSAQRIIGPPEKQAKLQALFDSPDKYRLFESALQREAQLFKQSSKILGGSDTAKNLFSREVLDDDQGVTGAIAAGVRGGLFGSLTHMVNVALTKGPISDKTASKLADMLMSKDPHEVAAVVQLLEKQAESAAPRAIRGTAVERGAVGTQAALPAAPAAEQMTPPEGRAPAARSLIEQDIENENQAQPSKPELSLIERDLADQQ